MIGSKLADRYEIVRELGHGGMGVVYLARDPLLEREVAVKVLTPNLFSREVEDRFRREARVVARMDHPGIVPIYDTGNQQGSLYFVMPYVPGESLRSLLSRGGLRLGDVIDVGIQVAEALEYAHGRGVVHRDVKPENILVQREGEVLRVRVTDFGLAQDYSQTRITQAGLVVGTMAYVSPEQVSGEEVDGRSDLYSLGSVLYEALAGEVPFPQEYPAILYFIVHEKPKSPETRGVHLDEDLSGLVMRCLEKSPKDRPPRARDVAEELMRYRGTLGLSDRQRALWVPPRQAAGDESGMIFVGREPEMAELQRRLNLATAGECQLVVIGGEPGIGKTMLLEQLEVHARRRRVLVLHGRFAEGDRTLPFQGFCDAIQEYFRGKPTGSSAPADFSDLAPGLAQLFPVLSEVHEVRSTLASGVRSAAASPAGRATEFQDRTYVFDLLARSFTRIGAGKPLVLLLEDLHSAQASIEALEYIVRRLGATPTLLIATYRTTEVDRRHPLARMLDGFSGDRRFAHLVLAPFSADENRSYLETLLGRNKLDEDVVKKLHEATEGNPYFTRELVRTVIEARAILRDESGAWVLSGEGDLLAGGLPATVQQTMERRIERLPEASRDILAIASVLGRSFRFEDLEALASSVGTLEADVERLVKDGFLEEDRHSRGDVLRFSSGVLRDVLYGSLSRRRQRALHRTHAEALEKRHAGRLERVLAPLVHHWAQADVPEKVVEHGVKLLRKLLDAFSAEDAVRLGKLVLASLEDDDTGPPVQKAEVKTLLAAAYRLSGNIDSALKELDEAIRIFEREMGVPRLLAAVVQAAETAWEGRKIDETRRFLMKGELLGRNSNDPRTLARLLTLSATVANLRGEYQKAQELLDEAERLAPGPLEGNEELPVGGVVSVALASPVNARHPVDIKLDEEGEVFGSVCETLLDTDTSGNLVPLLAESWEVLEGGRSFAFELRDGVTFHDGRHLTANEVIAAWQEAMRTTRLHLPNGFLAIAGASEYVLGGTEAVSGLIAEGDRRLRVELNEPLPIYPALLTDSRTAVARRLGSGGVSGTGPFRLMSIEAGRAVLDRNVAWWKGSPARIDGIDFRLNLSSAEIARGLRSGDYDLARDVLPQDLEAVLRDRRLSASLVEAPKKNVFFALFNLDTPAGGNAAVRRALCGVVRPSDLVRSTLGRFAQPAVGLIPPGVLGHDPGRRHQVLQVEEARELLRSSRLPRPVRLRVALHPILQDRYRQLTSALLKLWDEVGVEVLVATSTMEEFLATREQNTEVDVRIGRWVADYDDPDNFTYNLFHSRVGEFRRFYSSPEVDRLAEEARLEPAAVTREKLYRRLDSLILSSCAVLPIFHDIDYRVASPRLRNVSLRNSPPWVSYSEMAKVGSGETRSPRRDTGGIVRVPLVDELMTLDRAYAYHLVHDEVLPVIFEGLARVQDARTVPWLASDWSVEDGGRSYRFRLRPNVRFHDGRLLTARDVRYSFEQLLLNQDTRNAWLLAPIRGAARLRQGEGTDLEGVEILSPAELRIHLEDPISFFPVLLSHPSAAIVPEGTGPGGSLLSRWTGTGPFRVARFEPGSRLELEANPHYWRKGFPKAEGLTFVFGVTPADVLAGFRSGEYAIAWDILPADVETLRRDPAFSSKYRQAPRLSTYFLVFNTHNGPLADEAVRHRITRRLDVEDAVRRHVGRLASPAYSLIPPGLLGHEPFRRTPEPPGSDGRLSGDVEVTIGLHSVYEGRCAGLSREVLRAMREAGLSPRVVHTRAEQQEFLDQASVDVVANRWIADYPDADTFVNGILHSRHGLVGRFCGDPILDVLIEKARRESRPETRHEIYRQIETIVAERALVLPLFHEQAYRFARPELQGLDQVSMSSPIVHYDRLWIE